MFNKYEYPEWYLLAKRSGKAFPIKNGLIITILASYLHSEDEDLWRWFRSFKARLDNVSLKGYLEDIRIHTAYDLKTIVYIMCITQELDIFIDSLKDDEFVFINDYDGLIYKIACSLDVKNNKFALWHRLKSKFFVKMKYFYSMTLFDMVEFDDII